MIMCVAIIAMHFFYVLLYGMCKDASFCGVILGGSKSGRFEKNRYIYFVLFPTYRIFVEKAIAYISWIMSRWLQFGKSLLVPTLRNYFLGMKGAVQGACHYLLCNI